MRNGADPISPNGRQKRRFSPAARHLAWLALTYVGLAFAIGAAQRAFPASSLPTVRTPKGMVSVHGLVRAAAAMLGALALTLPVAWVYLITRRRKGFTQSVVHTLIVLPIAVAGIMVLVQNSLPLAFSLAGIAALRFRNTLEDTKDAVYLFVATGIGISAAADQLDVGLVLSFVFSASIIILWWTNLGRTPARLKAKLTLRRLRETMETRIPVTGPRPPIDPLNAVLRVHASSAEAAQPAVEALLRDAAKQWELTGVTPGEHGFSVLDYVVRLRARTQRGDLLNDLRARSPHVVGAEFR